MKREEIIIRDPFILLDDGRYYLYGTRSETTWTKADGFDVYVSEDLEEWEGPKEIFKRPENFWADRNFWAPECIKLNNRYYLFVTFGAENTKKRIQILVSDSPDRAFVPLTAEPITPGEWDCIDATTYIDKNNKCWLIFSHGIPDVPDGAFVLAGLSADLTEIDTEPQILFYAKDAPWSAPIPFAKQEFGLDGENYFSDGPYVFYNEKNELCLLWSSWSEKGYAMGVSKSESGFIQGPWKHSDSARMYGGGHGMIFADRQGEKHVLWHTPNDFMKEHPVYIRLEEFKLQ